MKKITLNLLASTLACAFLFTACEKEKDILPPHGLRYTVYIGTNLDKRECGKRFLGNPAGDFKIKQKDGKVLLLKNKNVNLALSLKYQIEGQTGKYTSVASFEQVIAVDSLSDGYTAIYDSTFNNDKGDKITKILEVQAVLTTFTDNVFYQKNYSFSGDSIWDYLMGIGTVMGDLQISEIGTCKEPQSLTRYFDINGDIVLEAVTDGMQTNKLSAKAMKGISSNIKVNDSSRLQVNKDSSAVQTQSTKPQQAKHQ